MGFETITDSIEKKQWNEIIKNMHDQLNRIGMNKVQFTVFKNDGSYAKAKSGLPSVYWAFAKDQNRAWVELELKSRTKDKERFPQIGLYEYIKTNYKKLTDKTTQIIWDEDDRRQNPRKANSLDIRIKIYLENYIFSKNKNEVWLNTMIDLIKKFDPIIQSYKESMK